MDERTEYQWSANTSQVITYAKRTPLTKARKGGLKDTTVDDLLIALLSVRPPLLLAISL